MREIARTIKIYEIAAHKYYDLFRIYESKQYILPLLIGLNMTDKQKYEDFINGKAPQLFEEFMNDAACLDFFHNRNYSKEECDEFYNAALADDDNRRDFRDCLSLLSERSEYGND